MNSLVIIDTVASANDFLDNHYNDNQKYEIYSLHYSVVDFLESHNIKCIDFTAFITPNEAIKAITLSSDNFENTCSILDKEISIKICKVLNWRKINIFKSLYFAYRRYELLSIFLLKLFAKKITKKQTKSNNVDLFLNRKINSNTLIYSLEDELVSVLKNRNASINVFYNNNDQFIISSNVHSDNERLSDYIHVTKIKNFLNVWAKRALNRDNYNLSKLKYFFNKYFFSRKLKNKEEKFGIIFQPSPKSIVEKIFCLYNITPVKLFFGKEKSFYINNYKPDKPVFDQIKDIIKKTSTKYDNGSIENKLIIDFQNNFEEYFDLILYFDKIFKNYKISCIAWEVPTIYVPHWNIIIDYALEMKIPVIGKQHGGCYFSQVMLNKHHYITDFDRCDYYLSYASDDKIFYKTYHEKPRCKFINIGKNLDASNADFKKNVDIVFPISNCVYINEAARTPQSIISTAQYKILDEIEKRDDNLNIVKPFKDFNNYNFSFSQKLKNLKNTKIVQINFDLFLRQYSPKLVIMELVSTPLYDVINYDVDIFLLLDDIHPFSKYALKLLKKRVYCFTNLKKLLDAIKKYDTDKIVKLRDTSFSKAYVNNGTLDNLLKLNLEL